MSSLHSAQEAHCREFNLLPGTCITHASLRKRQENSVTLPLKVRELHRYFNNRQTREQKNKGYVGENGIGYKKKKKKKKLKEEVKGKKAYTFC